MASGYMKPEHRLKMSVTEVARVLKDIRKRHFQNPALLPVFENIVADFIIKFNHKTLDGLPLTQEYLRNIFRKELGNGN